MFFVWSCPVVAAEVCLSWWWVIGIAVAAMIATALKFFSDWYERKDDDLVPVRVILRNDPELQGLSPKKKDAFLELQFQVYQRNGFVSKKEQDKILRMVRKRG